MKAYLYRYFKIVKTNVIDSVPKMVVQFLVERAKKKARLNLNKAAAMFTSEELSNLLEDDPNLAAARSRVQKKLDSLLEAEKIISEVRHY
jgi:hypothetical protein